MNLHGKPPAQVTFVGHATVLIEMDGVRLLTDPILRRFIGPLQRQGEMPGPEMTRVDAVLISHLHGDHLDLPSLKKFDLETKFIVPKGAADYLQKRGFQNITEIEQDSTLDLSGVRITATRADHGGRQLPWVPDVNPLGFLIDGTCQIYFAGDTDFFPEMSEIGSRLELALLPVWGWGPNLGVGHMDPKRAAEALTHLNPALAVPIHWGTYCPIGMGLLRPSFLTRPPVEFAEYAGSLAPDVIVSIVQPGGTFQLDACD